MKWGYLLIVLMALFSATSARASDTGEPATAAPTDSPLFRADPWSDDDKQRQALYLGLHVVDWGQTRYIAENPNDYYERNPILGDHPSVSEVNRYFIATGVAHTLVTHYLPARYRPYWQWGTIGMELAYVVHNRKLGVRLSF